MTKQEALEMVLDIKIQSITTWLWTKYPSIKTDTNSIQDIQAKLWDEFQILIQNPKREKEIKHGQGEAT